MKNFNVTVFQRLDSKKDADLMEIANVVFVGNDYEDVFEKAKQWAIEKSLSNLTFWIQNGKRWSIYKHFEEFLYRN